MLQTQLNTRIRATLAGTLTVAAAIRPPAAPPIAAFAQPPAAPGIYIPADKRHQGLSRFDLLPFTDRKKGDPDRYRALNPKYVHKENGHYYFQITAKPNTRLYDETLKDKGALTETAVPADLTNVKEGINAENKSVRYVYVKDKGYVLRSALTSAAEIKAGHWFYFPLKSGKHPLFDGTGIVRGTLSVDAVKLNYGQQKEINGERCYYAFSTSILLAGTSAKGGASGWISASAIQDGNDPDYSPEVVAKMQPAPTTNDTFTTYEVTGGDPQATSGKDASGKPIYKFGYQGADGAFIEYKVLPGIPRVGKESIRTTDYLKRNDDVINFGFNISGVSNDTYRISSAKRPLTFHRSSDKDATAIIDMFFPKDATHDGLKPIRKMLWAYGYIDEGTRKRWGWIPLDALKPKQK